MTASWASEVRVRDCGDGRAEIRTDTHVLNVAGGWDPIPNETSPAWEAEHRFPLYQFPVRHCAGP